MMSPRSYKNRIYSLFLLAAALFISSCTAVDPERLALEKGYHYLFDGLTLNGWHTIGGQATFSVDKGEILGVHGPGANTFLRTDKTYSDFILKMDMRFDERGNSGIMFRAQQREDGRAYGYQYELDSNLNRRWSGGIYDEARRGWLVPLKGDDYKSARQAIKIDDWNSLVIEAIGGSIKTWLNGVPISDLTDAMDLDGFIGLQVHAGNRGRIRWRNIRIKEQRVKELGKRQWTTDMIADPKSWVGLGFEPVTAENRGLKAVRDSSAEETTLLRTRLPLENFAIRFKLEVCDKPTIIKLREWRNSGSASGLHVALTTVQASISLKDGEQLYSTKLKSPGAEQLVTITAVGDAITVAVGRTHIGSVLKRDLPPRGVFSITPPDCDQAAFRVEDLAWVDLNTGDEKKAFYRTVDVPAAPELSPHQALQSFSIAPGFKVELVVAEPLVVDPVAMDWDENGRLYVVEMRGYMPDAFGRGQHKPVGRVVRLEDTNGDGQMDSQTVFLDGLIHPRAVAVVAEGVLIGEPSNLWLCSDNNGNGVCDDKRRVGEYGIAEDGSVEHRENSLMAGLDNWLYNAKSNRRLRLNKGKLEVSTTRFRGQWGMTQDDSGRLLYTTNSNLIIADLFPAELLLREGSHSPTPGLGVTLDKTREVFSVRVNPGINRSYIEGRLRPDGRLKKATAVSGLAAYRGDQFPEEYRRDVFIAEPSANIVVQQRLTERGIELDQQHITYPDAKWGQREFLASTDERFRPVDIKVGPDGALYIIDMYRGILQDVVFLTEELREQVFARGLDRPIGRGRIWRIVSADNAIRRAAPALQNADIGSLIDALGHSNGWWRDTAKRLLVARAGELNRAQIDQLHDLSSGTNTLAAVHALWTLQGVGTLTRSTVMAALKHPEQNVAVQALRAGASLLSTGDIVKALTAMGTGTRQMTKPLLKQQLVFALRDHNSDSRAIELLMAMAQSENLYMRLAVISAMRGREAEYLNRILANKWWQSSDPAKLQMISSLTAEAYRSLRSDITVEEAASNRLLSLLNVADQQRGSLAWRQAAMLKGLREVTRDDEFQAAGLDAIHPLFVSVTHGRSAQLSAARDAAAASFTWPDGVASNIEPLTAMEEKLAQDGKQFYKRVCAGCHGGRGQGSAGVAPALSKSSWVTGSPQRLARIVLNGLEGPVVVHGKEWNGVMPGHANMDGFNNDTSAGLLTYIRRAWGNAESAVSADLIKQVKQDSVGRSKAWTVAELKALAQ